MHDEFSAIFRAQFNTFSELIKKGVIPDAHPPGVQSFIYILIKIFGVHEPVLKFPFLLMGVGSVIFVYLVGKKWFGVTTGLLSAALVSVLQYNIFYSQIIRPYEAGLFFTLGTVFFWTKVVFDEKIKKQDWVFFTLFITINGYIHAFSIFMDLLIATTGLFFIKKQRLKSYLVSGFISFILLLPGLFIFFIQLKRGDIGGWLGKPQMNFIVEYFKYIFHFSTFFFSAVFFLTVYFSFKFPNKKEGADKFRVLGVIWFLVTFITAFLYSVLRTPVIQYSTLYFAFPFLVIVFFSFMGKLPAKFLILSVSIILFTGASTLILEREHYRLMFHQGLDEIPRQVINDIKNPGLAGSAVVLQTSNSKMFDYYFSKYKSTPDYFALENKDILKPALEYVHKKNSETIIVGIADYAPLNFLEVVKSRYPHIIKRLTSQNMEYWILSKFKGYKTVEVEKLETPVEKTGSFFMPGKKMYMGNITINPDSVKFGEYDVLNVKAKIVTDTIIPDALLVTDWKTSDGKSFFWSGAAFKEFYIPGDSTYNVVFSTRMMNFKNIPKNSKIKVYIWKRDNSDIKVKNIRVYLTSVDAVEFGLFKRIIR